MRGYRSEAGTGSLLATSRPVMSLCPVLVTQPVALPVGSLVDAVVGQGTGLSPRRDESIEGTSVAFGNHQWKPNAPLEPPV